MNYFCSFSEAIRKGLTFRPNQAYFKLSVRKQNATCVVGAGLEAMAGRLLHGDAEAFQFRDEFLRTVPYPYLRDTTAPPCGCDEPLLSGSRLRWGGGHLPDGERQTGATVFNILVHLNNHHQWSREQIADWLEKYEESIGYVTITEEPARSEIQSSALLTCGV